INGSISDQQHRLSLEKMISDYERDYKKSLSIDEKMLTLEKQKENGGDLSRVFGNLSLSCFQLKMFTKQTVYAEKTIEIANQMLEEARLDELLYITRKIRALALSGKKDEARELLRVNRYHRLCECCPYHSCKDMEVFEMEIEIISGNYQKAYEMASFGKKRWPDEEAFLIMENALKKKVK
ncbi:MAG: hypothetical protein II126_02020, partial [Erysipelotrichaceae bacterium]|nr:hypothetical protein [Erysipelotrichaceae bacterium]